MWCRCVKATLYSDGKVRCDLSMKLAKEECAEKEFGSIKFYKAKPMPKTKIVKEVRNDRRNS